jgi:hypothetical protein
MYKLNKEEFRASQSGAPPTTEKIYHPWDKRNILT